MNATQIPKNIENYMEKKGWSASELARLLEVPVSNIYDLFKGRNKNPSSSLVLKMLERTEIATDYLLWGRGPMEKGEEQPQGDYSAEVVGQAVELVLDVLGPRRAAPSVVAESVLEACDSLTAGVAADVIAGWFRRGVEAREAEVSGVPLPTPEHASPRSEQRTPPADPS